MHEETFAISPLFIGLTRPAMKLGITLDYLAVSALITLCCTILGNSPIYLCLYVPLHIFGWLMCRIDPFIFQLLAKRVLCAYCPNKTIWGCVSYEPF